MTLESIKKPNNIEAQILFLAMNERKKSLKFYENLLGLHDEIESLRVIFSAIADKERAILTKINAAFEAINAELENTSNDKILLPSALPSDILQELLDEMGELDIKSLNLLALGVESHHLKTCDFLLKKASDSRIIDALYQLQALSYNHHIPLLQGEMPKKSPKETIQHINNDLLMAFLQILQGNTINPNTLPPIRSISDLLEQSPLFSNIKTSLDNFQNFYTQTKIIVKKLECGELEKDELVAFLQKLRF